MKTILILSIANSLSHLNLPKGPPPGGGGPFRRLRDWESRSPHTPPGLAARICEGVRKEGKSNTGQMIEKEQWLGMPLPGMQRSIRNPGSMSRARVKGWFMK